MDLSALLRNGADALTRGDYKSAQALYSEGLVACPADARFHAQRATCFWKQGQFAKAAEDALSAIAAEPWATRHWLSYAMCLQAEGHDADARHIFQRVHAFRPEDARAKKALEGVKSKKKPSSEIIVLSERMREPRLSACLIVKNEERSLEACLESLRAVCDQIVVVDTGSSDATVQIAARAGATIAHFEWCDDFSKARNASLALADGDWILSFDADATLAKSSGAELRGVLRDELRGAFSVIMDNTLDGGRHSYAQVVRVFRNHPHIRYQGRIHEQITPAIQQAGFVGGETRVTIHHHGYQSAIVDGKDKLARNERLLLQELDASPDDPYWLYQLGKNHMMAKNFASARAAFHRACVAIAAVRDRAQLPYAKELYAAAPRLLLAVDAIEEAIAVADEGARHFPRAPDIAFFRGQALLSLGRPADAAACFQVTVAERERLADPSLLPLAEEALRLTRPKERVPALLENDVIAVKACRRGTFMYNRHDPFIGRALELYGEWCDAELRLLIPLLKPGMWVLDVGAHIGTHTVPMARAVGPHGQVVAFEPQGFVHQMLSGNIALNALPNVSTVRAAVGAEAGMIDIPRYDPHEQRNFGAVAAGAGADSVELVCIDDFDLPQCHLIKVDVEGMEASVLSGAKATIAKHKPVLFIENDTIARSREVLEAIDALGYDAYWHIAPYYDPTNFFAETRNVFQRYQPEANILAVPAGTPVQGMLRVSGLDDDWKQAVQRVLQS